MVVGLGGREVGRGVKWWAGAKEPGRDKSVHIVGAHQSCREQHPGTACHARCSRGGRARLLSSLPATALQAQHTVRWFPSSLLTHQPMGRP